MISENTDPKRLRANEPASAVGLLTLASPFSVVETLDRLAAAVRRHDGTVFARIDHAAAAAGAGLSLRPTQVLIFGNPKAGTPVMQAAPTLAIDLPFKALAWQDESDRVWLGYNSTDYLAQRHHTGAGTVAPLAAVADLIAAALEGKESSG